MCRARCRMKIRGPLFKTRGESAVTGTKTFTIFLSSVVCLRPVLADFMFYLMSLSLGHGGTPGGGWPSQVPGGSILPGQCPHQLLNPPCQYTQPQSQCTPAGGGEAHHAIPGRKVTLPPQGIVTSAPKYLGTWIRVVTDSPGQDRCHQALIPEAKGHRTNRPVPPCCPLEAKGSQDHGEGEEWPGGARAVRPGSLAWREVRGRS